MKGLSIVSLFFSRIFIIVIVSSCQREEAQAKPVNKASSYSSEVLEKWMSRSRFYAGIHYNPSIDAGVAMGNKVAANIFVRIPVK
jgi:hypothetical protein